MSTTSATAGPAALPKTLAGRLLRQINLKEIQAEGQAAIMRTRFLVLGAGGLGSPALMFLASSGACRITVADDDEVSESNLSRQLLHHAEAIGVNKALNAKQMLPSYNPLVEVEAIQSRMKNLPDLEALLEKTDIVLDCSDNLATRHLINRAAKKRGIPLVFGSALRFSGQASVFDFRSDASPCFRCLFDEDDAGNDEKAADYGVFTPLTGIIGTLMAGEALKIAAGIPSELVGRILIIDLLKMRFDTFSFGKTPGCPVCGKTFAAERSEFQRTRNH